MRRIDELDLYEIDELLDDDERRVRDAVREWVDARVLPHIEQWAWDCHFPRELVAEMGSLDLLGAPYSAYGLPGLNAVAYGLINQELERGDSALRSFVSVQTSLVMYPILEWGSQAHKDRWIPALGRGEAIGCFGLTEPDFGSNPGGMRTRAERDGDGWILNGEKAWITNGSIADVAVVWARTPDGIRGFLVERGSEGFSTVEHKGKYSLRASVTSQLVFQDCRVPADSLLPGTDSLKNALTCLTQARYGIAWGALGSAMATFGAALDYASTRIQFKGTADRRPPAPAGQAGLDVQRDPQGPAPRAAARPPQGPGQAEARGGVARQAQQRLDRPRLRAAGARDPRRERHRQRVPDHAPPHEPRDACGPTRAPTTSTPWCSATT